MKLTVLGSAGSYPAPGRVCSSYLVETAHTRLLIDAGNGSLANLQQIARPSEISAVIVTHQHVDHMADLVGLYHIRRFHPEGPAELPVYTTAGVIALMDVLAGDPTLHQVCRFHQVGAGARIEVGDLTVECFPARHPVETLALRVESAGSVLAYSADSGPAPELVACARGANLFLCESTWVAGRADHPKDLHLNAAQAGQCASEAGAQELVLTHVAHPGDPAAAVTEARYTYAGPCSAATDLAAYPIGE